MVCERFKDGLEALAQGEPSPSAAGHVAVCSDCAWRLTQMRRLVQMLRETAVASPARLVARLLGDGRKRSGARRSETSEFALHVGVDGLSLHLAYAPISTGWEVLGRAPDSGWSVLHAGAERLCGPSGRFRIVAKTLGDTMFTLRNDETEIDVPSAREMIDLGA